MNIGIIAKSIRDAESRIIALEQVISALVELGDKAHMVKDLESELETLKNDLETVRPKTLDYPMVVNNCVTDTSITI